MINDGTCKGTGASCQGQIYILVETEKLRGGKPPYFSSIII
jgi:hypothetical protein